MKGGTNKDQKLIVMYFNINVSPRIMERLVLLHKLDTLVFLVCFFFVYISYTKLPANNS